MTHCRWCYAILAAVLLLAGWQYSRAAEAQGRAQEAERAAEQADSAAQATQNSVQVLLDDLARVEDSYAADSALWADRNDSLKREIRLGTETEAQAAGDEARAASGVTANLARMERLARESRVVQSRVLAPLVDSTQAAHRRQREADERQEGAAARIRQGLEARVALLQQDTAALRDRIRARDEVEDGLREQVAALENLVAAERRAKEEWKAAAKPGFFAGLWQDAPVIAGTAAATIAACTFLDTPC